MNERLTLDDLSHLIMVKHNIAKEDADRFLDGFLSVIEEGLLCDRYVRVKGIGTFKLIEENIENRISTSKIVFVPDSDLKDAVNKPFSHFESTVLNENVHFDDIEEVVLPDNSLSDKDVDEDGCIESENVIIEPEIEPEIDPGVEPDSCSTRGKDNYTPDSIDYIQHRENNTKPQRSLVIASFIAGVFIGAIVSWVIYDYLLPVNKIVERNIISSAKTPEQVFPDTVETIDAHLINRDINSDNSAHTDSLAESAGTSVSEIKKEAIIVYSEKKSYKIVGTLETYTIKKGNTLARIAYKYYKNKKMWPYIVQYNKDVIKNPNNVPIGTKINIPELEVIE